MAASSGLDNRVWHAGHWRGSAEGWESPRVSAQGRQKICLESQPELVVATVSKDLRACCYDCAFFELHAAFEGVAAEVEVH